MRGSPAGEVSTTTQMMMKFAAVLLLLGSVVAEPLDSCDEQATCLSIAIGVCNTDDTRQVCLSWKDEPDCLKDGSESVSHACPGSQGPKTEDWPADDWLCVTVLGGEPAIFGVKDGRGCGNPGSYVVDGTGNETAACTGPLNSCAGNNAKECQWSFPTEPCTTEPHCPSTVECHAEVPCVAIVDGMECPCTTLKYVYV